MIYPFKLYSASELSRSQLPYAYVSSAFTHDFRPILLAFCQWDIFDYLPPPRVARTVICYVGVQIVSTLRDSDR
jgi:hypothetical protein